jgi:hypothetical protein
LKFPRYDANEKLRSKRRDSFVEFIIAKILRIGIAQRSEKNCSLKKKNENGGINLQKNQESTKEHNSKS